MWVKWTQTASAECEPMAKVWAKLYVAGFRAEPLVRGSGRRPWNGTHFSCWMHPPYFAKRDSAGFPVTFPGSASIPGTTSGISDGGGHVYLSPSRGDRHHLLNVYKTIHRTLFDLVLHARVAAQDTCCPVRLITCSGWWTLLRCASFRWCCSEVSTSTTGLSLHIVKMEFHN